MCSTNADQIACPFCEAPVNQPCVGGYGKRTEPHFTRQLAAEGKLTTPVVTTQRQLWSLMDRGLLSEAAELLTSQETE